MREIRRASLGAFMGAAPLDALSIGVLAPQQGLWEPLGNATLAPWVHPTGDPLGTHRSSEGPQN